ncbi:MAG: class II aldolase/adducin family protein [Actinomycetia bacterium]|nr:class II aldolase/adducin family protein [Actinomycetes bacterium]
MQETELAGLKQTVATGCRILAHQGLAEDILGHISVRIAADSALVRCRGPREQGLLFTTSDDVRVVRLSGGSVDDDSYSVPQELPIHTSVLAARPDVQAVLHAHPPWVVAADLAEVPLLPMVGAYNIPAARMAADGIPVYPRGVLIRRAELGDEMAEHLGGASACVLRGHGITTVGATVEQAVARALAVNSLARMVCRVKSLGGTVAALPDDDLAELPDLGSGFNDTLIWRHYCARLAHDGLDE